MKGPDTTRTLLIDPHQPSKCYRRASSQRLCSLYRYWDRMHNLWSTCKLRRSKMANSPPYLLRPTLTRPLNLALHCWAQVSAEPLLLRLYCCLVCAQATLTSGAEKQLCGAAQGPLALSMAGSQLKLSRVPVSRSWPAHTLFRYGMSSATACMFPQMARDSPQYIGFIPLSTLSHIAVTACR